MILRRALAVLFAVASVSHVLRAAVPAFADGDPAWRHLLFVAINAGAAVALATGTRSKAVAFAFVLLLFQQVASHGSAAWRAWFERGEIDWASLGVLVVMPLATGLMIARARTPRAEEGS